MAIWVGASVLVGGLILRAWSWLEVFYPRSNAIAWWEWVYYPTYNRLDGLLFGVCAAAVADQYSFAASVFSFPLIAVAYGCLLIAALSPSSVLYRVRLTTTSLIATWSYSIYLTHKGVIHLSQELLASFGLAPDSGITLILTTMACVVVAWLLNVAVERPFMQLRATVLSRLRMVQASGPMSEGGQSVRP